MFAKLFNTELGQCLVQTFDGPDDADYTFDIHITYDSHSPFDGVTALVTKKHCYEGTDEGEEGRDAAFEAFDQAEADAIAVSPL